MPNATNSADQRPLQELVRDPTTVAEIVAALPTYLDERLELHSTDLCGAGKAFSGVAEGTRRWLVKSALDVIENHECVFVGGCVDKARLLKRYGEKAHPPAHLAMIALIEKLDEFLAEKHENGLIIGDAVDDVAEHKRRMALYQERGTPYPFGRPIRHVIDSIHFVDSVQSYLVQLADIATYLYAQDRLGGTRWTAEWERVKKVARCKPFN